MSKSCVVGVGMTKFTKPGTNDPYEVMAANAILMALEDAGLSLENVNQAFASYVYGDSACGQAALYQLGHPGVPVFNVNNNCSSGSSAIYLARQAVESGAVDCALAFGFEAMQPGALQNHWSDRLTPGSIMIDALNDIRPEHTAGAPALTLFGNSGFEYLETYGATPDLFAKVAVKTRNHAVKNPLSLFSKPLTVDEVMASDIVYPPHLRKLMCCPPTCGAAAALITSRAFARKHGITRPIEIIGQGMATDTDATFKSARNLVGQELSRTAARMAYEEAGLGPEDADVVELHDCFTTNEVVTYEGLGLCGEGEATKFVDDGDNTHGGKVVVNPSGGLMSKGHPLGATGLAQCVELVWHLRDQAGERQVEGARIGLQHNIGVPGGAIVTMYKQAEA